MNLAHAGVAGVCGGNSAFVGRTMVASCSRTLVLVLHVRPRSFIGTQLCTPITSRGLHSCSMRNLVWMILAGHINAVGEACSGGTFAMWRVWSGTFHC